MIQKIYKIIPIVHKFINSLIYKYLTKCNLHTTESHNMFYINLSFKILMEKNLYFTNPLLIMKIFAGLLTVAWKIIKNKLLYTVTNFPPHLILTLMNLFSFLISNFVYRYAKTNIENTLTLQTLKRIRNYFCSIIHIQSYIYEYTVGYVK